MTELAVPVHPELARLAQARAHLEASRDLAEVKEIRDMAAAMQRYAQAKNLGADAVRYAQEIVNRAERRIGQILEETPKQAGGDHKSEDFKSSTPANLKSPRESVGWKVSARGQQLAAVPDEVFEANAHKDPKRIARVAREAAAEEKRKQQQPAKTRHGDIEIRHGDFRDVTFDLDGTVDAIITDPPYPKLFDELWQDVGVAARRLLKPTGVLAVMCGTRLELLYMAEQAIGAHMRRRWMGVYLTPGQRWRDQIEHVATGWKPILIYAHPDADTPPRWINDDVFNSGGTTHADKRFHHWGQNEHGFVQLVERLTEPGQIVVDPFLGGGTTAVVCKQLGRRFVGCDVDAAAVATARERVA